MGRPKALATILDVSAWLSLNVLAMHWSIDVRMFWLAISFVRLGAFAVPRKAVWSRLMRPGPARLRFCHESANLATLLDVVVWGALIYASDHWPNWIGLAAIVTALWRYSMSDMYRDWKQQRYGAGRGPA